MNFKSKNFENEFQFRTSRSSGAGGQHVNTTETKVELIFNVLQSTLLSAEEKKLFFKKWETRINEDGDFKISSSRYRSQSSNKAQAIEKFYEILEKGLKKEKKRIATKTPKTVKEKRRKKKKLHSEKKTERKLKTKDFL